MISLYASPTATVQAILERLESIAAHPDDAEAQVADLAADVRAWLNMSDGSDDPALIELEF